jgi:predicted TIM-barrel fold metal-dependent hydrolase
VRNGYRIIDADRHVFEPVEMWARYLPPAFASHAPYYQKPPEEAPEVRLARLGARALLPSLPILMIDGEPLLRGYSESARLDVAASMMKHGPPQGMTPESQIRNMDRWGIDVAFLYPTWASYLVAIDTMDPALASAFARAYNAWLADYCALSPERLRGVGLISLHDPAEMISELGRVTASGFRAVVMRPNPVKGRQLSDPAYEPFWAACE